MTYRYFIPAYGQTLDDAHSFESCLGGSWLAEEAAEDYHTNHDGWEDSWPIDFAVETSPGTIEVFTVNREVVASFLAHKKTTVPDLDHLPEANYG
jgi:hypothetical protein